MKIGFGKGTTKFGPGVQIDLDGNEIARAIDAYMVARGVVIRGARTISINGELIEAGEIYVDPSGFVITKGKKFDGLGTKEKI